MVESSSLHSSFCPSSWIVSSLEAEDESTSTDRDYPSSPTSKKHLSTIHRSCNTTRNRRLIIHFDINETIWLGDQAGGDSKQDSIQKMLAKSAFCQMPNNQMHKAEDHTNNNKKKENQDMDHDTNWEHTQQLTPTHWWNGQEMSQETTTSTTTMPPPLYTGWKWPPNCCPFYRTALKPQSQKFVQYYPIYRPLLQACFDVLPSHLDKDDNNESSSSDHIVLPAFYETLSYLIETSECKTKEEKSDENISTTTTSSQPIPSSLSLPPPFTIVFRTFGSDLQEMATKVSQFALGQHPDYPNVYYPRLILPDTRLYQGRWKQEKQQQQNHQQSTCNSNNTNTNTHEEQDTTTVMIYQLWNYPDEDTLIASDDAEICTLLQRYSIIGIRDDYPYWKQHHYHPTAGKPLWVIKSIQNNKNNNNNINDDDLVDDCHPILFDDNIHNLKHDGIACIRRPKQNHPDNPNITNTFETINAQTSLSSQDGDGYDYIGTHLIRVPTIEPVLHRHWYITQIQQAQMRWWRQQQQQQQKLI